MKNPKNYVEHSWTKCIFVDVVNKKNRKNETYTETGERLTFMSVCVCRRSLHLIAGPPLKKESRFIGLLL